ncbi:hypothetical protein ILYODFUR_035563 [Ilyodon furcidens]|uniref:Uncharacterized protein n=1 Tax=Ilyodon furcidens TaxID=33524 RepID=A0ABV0VAP8_9TELE
MEELQASVTSVFGSILKMDSTQKVSLTPCFLHSQMKLMSTFTDGWKLPVLRLQASSDAAAAAQQERRDSSGREKLPVKSTQEVEAAAQRRVRALGGDPTDRRCILSQMEVQFGLYRGQTFQWLLTHDLGYTVGLSVRQDTAAAAAAHSCAIKTPCWSMHGSLKKSPLPLWIRGGQALIQRATGWWASVNTAPSLTGSCMRAQTHNKQL